MADDHERCEWMNVSSGTGSPGQSRIKGCKMAVVLLYLFKKTLRKSDTGIYGLNVHPDTEPTVTKNRRKHRTLTGVALFFGYPIQADSR